MRLRVIPLIVLLVLSLLVVAVTLPGMGVVFWASLGVAVWCFIHIERHRDELFDDLEE